MQDQFGQENREYRQLQKKWEQSVMFLNKRIVFACVLFFSSIQFTNSQIELTDSLTKILFEVDSCLALKLERHIDTIKVDGIEVISRIVEEGFVFYEKIKVYNNGYRISNDFVLKQDTCNIRFFNFLSYSANLDTTSNCLRYIAVYDSFNNLKHNLVFLNNKLKYIEKKVEVENDSLRFQRFLPLDEVEIDRITVENVINLDFNIIELRPTYWVDRMVYYRCLLYR